MLTLNQRLLSRIVITAVLIVLLVFPISKTASAQTSPNYFVTVNPTTDTEFYTPVGSSLPLSFEVFWSYGANVSQPIKNATVEILVSGQKSGAITTLFQNTTSGTFQFNYTSKIADILTFTPIQLTTQDAHQFNSTEFSMNGNQAVGLTSGSVKVWCDSFHVDILSYSTDLSEKITATFNITYLLLPENGLTLPAQDTYSGQAFLPKIIHDATVTVNGVQATEIQSGIYTANVTTILPTAYVVVKVSQQGWVTTDTGFDFPHNANQPTWSNIGFATLIVMVAFTLFGIVLLKKTKKPLKQTIRPFLGGILLLSSSLVSVYWAVVGVEASMHGFNWVVWVVFCVFSTVLGVSGALCCFWRKKQTFVFLFICITAVVNTALLKIFLDSYSLSVPLLPIYLLTASSALSGLLIGNSDEQFSS